MKRLLLQVFLFGFISMSSVDAVPTDSKAHWEQIFMHEQIPPALHRLTDSISQSCLRSLKPHPYRSRMQGRGHLFMTDENIAAILNALSSGKDFDFILRHFPVICFEKNASLQELPGVADQFTTIRVAQNIQFPVASCLEHAVIPLKQRTGQWRYEIQNMGSQKRLYACYFIQPLQEQLIPVKYYYPLDYVFNFLNYSQLTKSERSALKSPNRTDLVAIPAFLQYINANYGQIDSSICCTGPDCEEDDKKEIAFCKKGTDWGKSLCQLAQRERSLLLALQECYQTGVYSDELTDYIALYFSPLAAIDLRIKRGGAAFCGSDQSPIINTIKIARLASQTENWSLFFEMQWKLLNNNYQAVSWLNPHYTNTYYIEFEQYTPCASSLLIGMSLQHHSNKHMEINLYSIGQALAATRYPKEVENSLIYMIGDTSLDYLNRVRAYQLFNIYCTHIPNPFRQQQLALKVQLACKQLQKAPKSASVQTPFHN